MRLGLGAAWTVIETVSVGRDGGLKGTVILLAITDVMLGELNLEVITLGD